MFQDIAPHKYSCEFNSRLPKAQDYVFISKGPDTLLKMEDGRCGFPHISDMETIFGHSAPEPLYFFDIDDSAVFLADGSPEAPEGYIYGNVRALEDKLPLWAPFAGATAQHLMRWYSVRRYCGRCGARNAHKAGERAMICPECGNVEYPMIAPVVIVAVKDGDRLLLTRYRDRPYRRHALIAGFIEIGETPEDAVKREVFEEAGVRVGNLKYWKSQPWGFSGSMLLGYTAELVGDGHITIDENELSEAKWFLRDELPSEDSGFSLTWSMIEAFRRGEI